MPGEPGDDDGPLHPRRGASQGSGFFITDDGYIVTNSHVVADAKSYQVVTQDGTELDAKLIGKDDRTDLALLKVDGKELQVRHLRQGQAEGRAVGARSRQSVRPGRDGDGRHPLG